LAEDGQNSTIEDFGLSDGPIEAASSNLIVDVDGFEGPLDLLLVLARSQKVDLKKISILALADQYLVFVEEARLRKLELAADYLVMAAWLAYLKSRLLLPEVEEEEGPSGEEMAARLAFQLQRLQAMRNVAARLMARNRLGRDVFGRGLPEGERVIRRSEYGDTIYDLLKAYSTQRIKQSAQDLQIIRAPVFAIEDARKRIEGMLGRISDWSRLDALLMGGMDQSFKRTTLASSLTASLEMVRDGQIEIRQLGHFSPIYIRRRDEPEANIDDDIDQEEGEIS
jgi:segregation and condensation protein A